MKMILNVKIRSNGWTLELFIDRSVCLCLVCVCVCVCNEKDKEEIAESLELYN